MSPQDLARLTLEQLAMALVGDKEGLREPAQQVQIEPT